MAGASDTLPFEDGKAADALRTIGEVAAMLNIRQHVLRYWEEQFPTLKPVKRSGGRRYYRPEDVALIARIDRMVHQEGLTLRGARMAIEAGEDIADYGSDNTSDQIAANAPEISSFRASKTLVDDLLKIRDRLARALAIA